MSFSKFEFAAAGGRRGTRSQTSALPLIVAIQPVLVKCSRRSSLTACRFIGAGRRYDPPGSLDHGGFFVNDAARAAAVLGAV